MAVADGVAGGLSDPATPAGAALKTPAAVKFFYSFGQVVESGYLTINTFIFFYYTAVLGLSGSLVGAAVAISMCIDAALDPVGDLLEVGLRVALEQRVEQQPFLHRRQRRDRLDVRCRDLVTCTQRVELVGLGLDQRGDPP